MTPAPPSSNPFVVNLRHLDRHDLVLRGEVSAEVIGLSSQDDLIQLAQPLRYDLNVEKQEAGILVRGCLGVVLSCRCVRCLEPCEHPIELRDWARLLPSEGEDAVTPQGDLVDLTPVVREDILLAFPQHPLCDPGCRGLLSAPRDGVSTPEPSPQSPEESSVWGELNKLRF